jgi:hypothetical protein
MAGQRKALIVAVDEYDQEALKDLRSAAADAEALSRVLGDPQIGDFAVQVVRNQPSYVIQAQIEEMFSESRIDDVLLLHFSGHGLKSESGELFFAAANTRPNRLGSTAVAADFVQRCMRDSRSRSVVLLLDCCYGGAFAQGVAVRAAGDVNVLDSFPDVKAGGGRGRAVITASSAMEYAFEGDQLSDDQQRRPSVFTAAVVEGLATGDADRDEDGWVSLDELYDYVFDKVREQNPHQTPNRQFQLEGELYLARSRRKRIRPAPIPADLQRAIADSNMFTRLGAVSELRFRLASEDLSAAAAAYEVLTEMARTDTRAVAEPAAAVLAEAAVRPSRSDVHFGEVRLGSSPPPQTVELLGPAIARACVARPSHDWIHVRKVGDRLEISIDARRIGTLRGSVDLSGSTGEAVIAIDAVVSSAGPQTVPVAVPSPPTGRTRETVERPRPVPLPAPDQPTAAADQPVGAPVRPTKAFAGPAAHQAGPTAERAGTASGGQTKAVRTGAALAGIAAALLAGIAAQMSYHYLYPRPGAAFSWFEETFSTLPMIVAIVALLLWRRRFLTLGFLQGLLWPSAAWLTADLVAAVKNLTGSGAARTGAHYEALSDALGVVAVIALLAAWAPGASLRRGARSRAVPVLLVCCATMSQIAGAFLFNSPRIQNTATYTQGAFCAIVAFGVSWYAVSIASRAAGGVLILGWATTTVIWQIATIEYVRSISADLSNFAVTGVRFEFPLLVITAILAVIHMRGSGQDPAARLAS